MITFVNKGKTTLPKDKPEGGPISVKHMIHKRVAGWEPPRDHGHIHASDLMKEDEFCPREWILLDLTNRKRHAQFIGTSLRMTFDHGRSLEWNIRNKYLRDVVAGFWTCGVCGYEHQELCKAPDFKCPKCGYDHQWEYDEVRFQDPTSGVGGGIDTLLDVGTGKYRIIEIKSMDKDEFKTLIAPLFEHRFRTSLYLKLVDISHSPYKDQIDTNEASILYVSKSFGFKDETLKPAGISDAPFSPFKEFTIPRDDSLSETPLNKAMVVTAVRKDPALGIPCGVCKNALERRAERCACVTACFGAKYPGTLTWMEGDKPRHADKMILVLEE